MSTNTSANTTGGRRTRGPNDPERRDRIADAAIAVVAERGVEGVTHRAVAAVAGVPLGSTTYHFATLDDLLAMALHKAAQANVAQLREWEAQLPAEADLAGSLADLVLRGLSTDRRRSVVEYELYVAALHRPRLRPAASAWDAALAEVFARRTGPAAARLLAAAFCGLVMQLLLAETPPAHDELVAVLRHATG